MPRDSDTAPINPSDLPAGLVLLDRYRVERRLGRGGMGEVWLARDLLLGRHVALKRLQPEAGAPEKRRESVIREARRASRIVHQRVAAIYDVIETGGDLLLVMEHIEGSTLRERMAEPMPIESFWSIAFQCAEGLAAAHAQGVVHRDIKPDNLMLTGDGQIKILDFGVARRSASSAASTTTVTTTGVPDIAGTPEYMAPEAHMGAPPDERADIFSLGAVFYEILTGRRPFHADSYAAVVNRVLNESPPPAAADHPEVGAALSALVDQMLRKDPGERVQSAESLMALLKEARDGILPPAPDSTPAPARAWRPAPSRRTAVRAGATIAVVVALGAAWEVGRTPALPKSIHLAILPPAVSGESREEDFAAFALGFVGLLEDELHAEVSHPGFQLASFQEAVENGVRSPDDARKVQGVNLALVTTLEQEPDALRARLQLVDTQNGRPLRTRVVRSPASEPFEFIRRAHSDAVSMLALPSRPPDLPLSLGIEGAGTLRFWLRGSGRMRAAADTAALAPALDDLQMACLTEPTSGAARARLAAAELKRYDLSGERDWLDRAASTAREAVRLDSARAESYRTLGMALAARKDNADALAAMERACALDPTDDAACLRRARLYGRMGRRADELNAYVETIRLRPHAWQPYWWLATWYFREGRLDESAAAYRQMIELAPLLSKGYASLGGILVLRGDYAQAIDTLRRSIALRPTKVAFDNLGSAYFNSRRLDDAIAAYNQSFQFGFADYESWLNLGDAYYWLKGRQDLAEDAYRQAVRMGREEVAARALGGRSADVMISANLATVFPKLGQPDSARVYLARAVASAGSNPMVDYCAALALWQLEDRHQAIEWIDRSVGDGYPVAWLRDSPIFDEWRAEPRFAAILARAGAHEAATPEKGGT